MFSKELIDTFRNKETPFYFYDLDLLDKSLEVLNEHSMKYGFHVHFALKANFNDTILRIIQQAGLGADCVSGNEILKAIEIGFSPDKIVFAGVGKSDKEIEIALNNNIFAFNVESIQEISVIDSIAQRLGKSAQIALRINPNIDAKTHHYITTGLEENKFGINITDLPECIEVIKKSTAITLTGIHFHIGSQILDLNVYKSLCIKVNELNNWFFERGFKLKVLNVGGGLGVNYSNPDQEPIADFENYFNIFHQFLELKPGQEVHFELGRAIVAPCGSLISRALYIKEGIHKSFIILDAGMTELMRPALYQAYHKIESLEKGNEEQETQLYDVVGPICESSDCFGKEILLPKSSRNDLFAIRTAGAYGEVMASRYNLRDEMRFYFKKDS